MKNCGRTDQPKCARTHARARARARTVLYVTKLNESKNEHPLKPHVKLNIIYNVPSLCETSATRNHPQHVGGTCIKQMNIDL